MDAVINHMTGYWPSGTASTGSSSFDAGTESYLGVPYSRLDFNDDTCYTESGNIEDYSDAIQVKYMWTNNSNFYSINMFENCS